MQRIKDSRFISRSIAHSGAVLTYEKGLFVCKGDVVFPLTADVAKILCHYFETMEMDFIRGFDILRGLVATPCEVYRNWESKSQLSSFNLVPMPDKGWLLIYVNPDENTDEASDGIILDDEFLSFVVNECSSFMICARDRVIVRRRLWSLQKEMPDSKSVLCLTTHGLDLLLENDRIFSTTGADVSYWMMFVAFCLEALEYTRPGSMRFGIPFGDAGHFDLVVGDNELSVSFHQNYQGGSEMVGTIPITLEGLDVIHVAVSEFKIGNRTVTLDLSDEDLAYADDDDDEGEVSAS